MESFVKDKVKEAVNILYGQQVTEEQVQLQETRKDFDGDITVVVFPLLRLSKKPPEATATEIGQYLEEHIQEVSGFQVVKGFLNLSISPAYWINILEQAMSNSGFGIKQPGKDGNPVVVEYSSPNTNKPLHLGHVRNNLLGYSISKILEANGKKVEKVNLVNDRGIHICKSMLAWQEWGEGKTPKDIGKKGDHLVGDFYVRFDKEYKQQVATLIESGLTKEEAEKQAPVIKEAQEMLRKWEAGDKETVVLWEKMNNWVYHGFDETYKALGVEFDHVDYESETYLLGKNIVLEALGQGILEKKEDGSVWANLEKDGLDQKLLLRSDGTSVYMTQDIGTAKLRYDRYNQPEELIYVVGNEQDYHFKVLSLVLQKMGFEWGKNIQHLSYGMVELPEGKMKSREGTVVDADDLVKQMIDTAREMTMELGKLDDFEGEEAENIFRIIGLGALKYFILKVDPKKNMTFNPRESIDFNGNTGPFIQYTYARIQSLARKAEGEGLSTGNIPTKVDPNEKEISLIKLVAAFPATVKEAGDRYSPAIIANYVYELVKEYNQFYHDYKVLKEPDVNTRDFRLSLSIETGKTIKKAMDLLGIEVPSRM